MTSSVAEKPRSGRKSCAVENERSSKGDIDKKRSDLLRRNAAKRLKGHTRGKNGHPRNVLGKWKGKVKKSMSDRSNCKWIRTWST